MGKRKPFGQELLRTVDGAGIYAESHNQHELVKSVSETDIVVLSGPAGTGKTFISTVLAVKALLDKNNPIDKIIVTRPAIEAGEDLGYLPGDFKDKLDPYLRPIYDVLDLVWKKKEPKKIPLKKGQMPPPQDDTKVLYDDKIEVVPIAYMRGRSFHNCFILADEMQNATPKQLRLLMTRLGQNSKMIIDGDIKQSDIKGANGLNFITNRLQEKDIDGIDHIGFGYKDIRRNELIRCVEELFEGVESE